MADVQFVTWGLAAAAALKVADALLRDQEPWIVAAWVIAGASVRLGRVGAAIASLSAFAIALDGGSNHIVLYGWLAATAAIVPDRPGPTLRVLGMAVYGFATVHKLVGGTFLTGAPIASRTGWAPPLTVLLSIGAIAAQVLLVVALWRRLWIALPMAIVLHIGIIVVMSARWLDVLQLTVFNGLMIVVVAGAVGPDLDAPARWDRLLRPRAEDPRALPGDERPLESRPGG